MCIWESLVCETFPHVALKHAIRPLAEVKLSAVLCLYLNLHRQQRCAHIGIIGKEGIM